MKYPDFLQTNGTIGIIAPSFGCAEGSYRERFDCALENFRREGYRLLPGPNCYENAGIGKSNTAEKCAAEIMDFFTNDKCDLIFSAGGGETMCEDLSYVDFDRIAAAKPKWYMGYSDNTNLTFTLPVLTDTAAVYGPCVPAFSMEPWHSSLTDALEVLRGRRTMIRNYARWEKNSPETEEKEDPKAPYYTTEDFCMKIFRGEKESSEPADFSGRLLGGCLDCLQVLCGTKFDKVTEFADRYKDDGIIWFLESCDLNPMGMRRALWQMDNAGWFRNSRGFLIGRPLHFGEELMGMDCYNAVTGILAKYGVPIVMDLDIGHLPPMMPIVSGAVADVKAAGGSFAMTYHFR